MENCQRNGKKTVIKIVIRKNSTKEKGGRVQNYKNENFQMKIWTTFALKSFHKKALFLFVYN